MSAISEMDAERFALWTSRPDVFVRDLFDVTPDVWQDEALQAYPRSKRLAMKACKGPGKTAVLAWIAWHFLLTRPHPIIGVTSITGDNLRSNFWTELARWYGKSTLLQQLFEMTKTAITSREHPKTWKLEARSWAQNADSAAIGNALAGLHAEYIMWLLDESGDYPDAIMPTVEAIFSGSPKEAHIVQAGNPTRLGGPLYRACTNKHLWRVVEITGDPDNPKRSPRISVEVAREQIAQYGRDNPWVQVNIFGNFPAAAFNALIGIEDINEAMRRKVPEENYRNHPKVLGVDVARFGDDSSVMFPRQGPMVFEPEQWRNLDGLQGASRVSRKWMQWQADACFIDDTGGFGSSWIDHLKLLGQKPIGVNFSSKALQGDRYFNKRAEMFFNLCEWIKAGGALPSSCPQLGTALTQTTYAFKPGTNLMILEPKDMVKSKIGFSPDHADALALSFAFPVQASSDAALRAMRERNALSTRVLPSYDPFQELYKMPE